ncbi:hypothetical protein [Pseudarthrobacter sp. MDT1-22]
MSFEEDLAQRLELSKHEASMRDQAAEMSARAALQALDRLENNCREAATFLFSHNIPTEPLFEQNLQQTFWSGTKKVPHTLAAGWVLRDAYNMAITVDGGLWQSGFDDQLLVKCGSLNFAEARALLAAGETVETPMFSRVMIFPSVIWDPEQGFVADQNLAIRFRPSDHKSYEFDIEAGITEGVVQLVTEHSG